MLMNNYMYSRMPVKILLYLSLHFCYFIMNLYDFKDPNKSASKIWFNLALTFEIFPTSFTTHLRLHRLLIKQYRTQKLPQPYYKASITSNLISSSRSANTKFH